MNYKKLILEGQQDIKNTSYILRDFKINLDDVINLKKILVLIGPRRVGKTYMFYNIFDLLLSYDFSYENIVYVNFSNVLFDYFDISKLLETFFLIYPDKSPVFFFDEIQELENFDKILLYLQSKGYLVFVTGSNSKLLSREISTNLRGKYLEYFVYPLSFKEFLRFKNFEKEDYVLDNDRGRLKAYFEEFLKWGAFPEIVLVKSSLTKRDLINSYFKDMFYLDLIERYNIENEKLLKELIEKIFLNIGKEFSVQRLFNLLKSKGFKLGKPTLYTYLSYLENIFFISSVKNYSKAKNAKYYLYDVAFKNILFLSEDFGQRFENMVYLQLLKEFKDVYYKLDKKEVDFFIPRFDLNIQVVYHLDDENFLREIEPLKKQNGKKIIIYFEKRTNLVAEDIEFLSFENIFLQNILFSKCSICK